jgi:L-threonylcarbamoyladenylate synthase
MRPEIVPADQPAALARAMEVLRAGGLVVLPTDTVYGVAAHALLPAAVARLYDAKGRSAEKAIPLLLADVDGLRQVASTVPPAAWALARRFWPGALSLVVPRSPYVPDVVTGGGDTVAVRVPDHPVPRALIRRLACPLAATSANRSGEPAPVTAREAQVALADWVALVLDGGPCPGGLASTVLDLTASPPRVLRPGPLSEAHLRAVWAEAERTQAS